MRFLETQSIEELEQYLIDLSILETDLGLKKLDIEIADLHRLSTEVISSEQCYSRLSVNKVQTYEYVYEYEKCYKCEKCRKKRFCSSAFMSGVKCPSRKENRIQRLEKRANVSQKKLDFVCSTKKIEKSKSCQNKEVGICARCKRRPVASCHHIIPRKYGGEDFSENLLGLCPECHDFIEEKTEDWIESGRYYAIDVLKSLIVNDGFQVEDKRW